MRCLLAFLILVSSASAQSLDGSPGERARALALEGDPAAALAVLLNAPDLEPDDRALAARLALDLGQPHRALAVLAPPDSASVEASRLRGRVLEALGDLREAEMAYRHAYESEGVGVEPLARLVERRNAREAILLYRHLVARDSLNPTSWAALGRVLVRSDSAAAAEPVLRCALALYPRDEASAVSLAQLLPPDSSRSVVLRDALVVLPRSPELWRLRGGLRMRAGDLAGAADAYRNALAFGDSTASRLRDLGVALFYGGQYPEAVDVLRQSFRRDSTDATTLRVYGLAADANGDSQLGLRLLRRAADALGREALADLAVTTSRVYRGVLNDTAALEQVALAEALAPERATLVLHRAVLLHQIGRATEAKLAYREFLDRATEADAGYVPLATERLERIETMEQERVRLDLRRRLGE